MLVYFCPLQGEHQGAGHPCHPGNEQKDLKGHETQTEQVGKRILGKAGQQKKHKGDNKAALVDKMVEALIELCFFIAAFDGATEQLADGKGYPGTDGEGNGGLDKTRPGAEQIAAQGPGCLTGNGSKNNLQYL